MFDFFDRFFYPLAMQAGNQNELLQGLGQTPVGPAAAAILDGVGTGAAAGAASPGPKPPPGKKPKKGKVFDPNNRPDRVKPAFRTNDALYGLGGMLLAQLLGGPDAASNFGSNYLKGKVSKADLDTQDLWEEWERKRAEGDTTTPPAAEEKPEAFTGQAPPPVTNKYPPIIMGGLPEFEEFYPQEGGVQGSGGNPGSEKPGLTASSPLDDLRGRLQGQMDKNSKDAEQILALDNPKVLEQWQRSGDGIPSQVSRKIEEKLNQKKALMQESKSWRAQMSNSPEFKSGLSEIWAPMSTIDEQIKKLRELQRMTAPVTPRQPRPWMGPY